MNDVLLIHDFKFSLCSECCIISFGWFPEVWILCADISKHSVCSRFIGSLSRNNNQDEIVGVFTQEKVWFKITLSQSERGGMGRGHVCVQKQAVEGKDHKWKPVVSMWGTNGLVIARKEIHGMVEIKLLCFRWLSPFYNCVEKGFPGFA